MPLFHSNALFTAWAPTIARRRDARAPAALLGVGVPLRRPRVRRHLLQLRRQAARVHPRHARAARRRRQPAAPWVRQRSVNEADVRRFERALRLPAHRRVRADRDRRVDQPRAGHAGGLARQAGTDAVEGHRPRRPVRSARVRASTTTGKLLNAERGHGRDRQLRRAGLRGVLEERGRRCASGYRDGCVLDRRPRLPRRERLLLLRRAQRRLDPGRRRELRRARPSSAS